MVVEKGAVCAVTKRMRNVGSPACVLAVEKSRATAFDVESVSGSSIVR